MDLLCCATAAAYVLKCGKRCLNVIVVDRRVAAPDWVRDDSSGCDARLQYVPAPTAKPTACLRHP